MDEMQEKQEELASTWFEGWDSARIYDFQNWLSVTKTAPVDIKTPLQGEPLRVALVLRYIEEQNDAMQDFDQWAWNYLSDRPEPDWLED